MPSRQPSILDGLSRAGVVVCPRALRKVALLLLATGCGHALYAVREHEASGKLEEAKELGAESRAPYEYTLAKEHLDKAMTEASEADYGDACELAQAATEYAQEAVHASQLTTTRPPAPPRSAEGPSPTATTAPEVTSSSVSEPPAPEATP